MAAAHVVITQPNSNTPAVGGLFEGVSFFLIQRLPQRSSFVERIQANGGRVVKLENQADYIIADHYRPDCPPGSVSYTFIEAAIRAGTLPDPTEHAAGPRRDAPRQAGSGVPGKSTRTPFTAEDDRVLWQWVKQSKGPVKGNEIYKQLEAQNPRHTWQAWRDRYVKRLMDKPPAGVEVTVPANPPPSPPTAQDEQQEIVAQGDAAGGDSEAQEEGRELASVREDEFTEDELELLLNQGKDIEAIADDREDEAWAAWAQAYPKHSAQSWRRFWKEVGQPAYEKHKADEEDAERREQAEQDAVHVADRDEIAGMDGAADRTTPGVKPKSGKREPPSSQKRKAAAVSSIAERIYGKKKRKSDSDEIFGQEDSSKEELASAPNQAMPTSELNRQAQAQLEEEARASIEGALPTEDATRDTQAEAQALFDEEVFGIPRKPAPTASHFMSNLLTSDINRAADEQLSRESLEVEGEEESSVLRTPSVLSEEGENESVMSGSDEVVPEEENEDESNSAQTQSHGSANADLVEVPAARLTEENLASQQAQHKAQLLRGADLPEDNDVQDEEQQNEYMRFLQDVTRRSAGPQAMPAITFEMLQSVPIESQLPHDHLETPHDPLDTAAIGELPLSSQQEIDGVLDEMIQWPDSPGTAQRRDVPQSQDQSLRLQTQVHYPELPNQSIRASHHEQEEVLSSQPSMLPEVSYPSLPESQPDSADGEQTSLELPQRSQPSGSRPQLAADDESSISSEEGTISQDGVVDEDDIDLSMPAPVGGWSSSPAKAHSSHSSQATPIASRQQHQIKQERQSLANSPLRSQVATVRDVAELSSTSSSSSSSSAESEAPPPRSAAMLPRKTLDTQDIMNAETQQPDFEIPLPPDSDDGYNDVSSDFSNPNSPVNPNTAESQRLLGQARVREDDLDGYIQRVVVVHGFKVSSVVAALKCTSMRTDLAELVMLEDKLGKEMPNNVPGIWSEKEDHLLESGNATALRKLEEKHSWKELEERMKFLQDWRDESEDGDGE